MFDSRIFNCGCDPLPRIVNAKREKKCDNNNSQSSALAESRRADNARTAIAPAAYGAGNKTQQMESECVRDASPIQSEAKNAVDVDTLESRGWVKRHSRRCDSVYDKEGHSIWNHGSGWWHSGWTEGFPGDKSPVVDWREIDELLFEKEPMERDGFISDQMEYWSHPQKDWMVSNVGPTAWYAIMSTGINSRQHAIPNVNFGHSGRWEIWECEKHFFASWRLLKRAMRKAGVIN